MSITTEQSHRVPHRLLPILAHELLQPLNAILLALDAVHQECDDASAVREAGAVAKHQALHMARIINDVMDISRDAYGKTRLRMESVDMTAIVADVIATVRPSLASRSHRLSVALPPEPVALLADSSRLHQVLTNLLNNAAKFTEPGGCICLTVEASGGFVIIRVRDNGRGISPDLLPCIFEPFQQGEDSVNCGRGRGVGLGLSIVRSLVELHGGSVAATSQGSGTGSEFVVRLPTRYTGRPANALKQYHLPSQVLPSPQQPLGDFFRGLFDQEYCNDATSDS
jgi:signal transduction histidine kinase